MLEQASGFDDPNVVERLMNEQEKAHKTWLEEKHEVLHLLESIKEDIINLNDGDNSHPAIDDLDYVIDFIEKGDN